MKRIPFDRFSDKRFYYANAPPCKQFFSLTTDFTWRILLCTKKFLIRFDLLRINGISRIPRFMHTVPVLLIFEPHSQGYRCINNWRCWYIPNWKETFRDFTRNIQSLPFRNPLLLQKNIEEELGWWHTSYEKGQEVTNGAYKNRNISYSWCYAKSEAQSYDCYYVFRRTSCFRSHTSSLWWYFTHEQNHTHPWWEKSLWSLYFACRPDARDIDRILVSMWQTKRDFVPKFMDRGLSYKR